LVVQAADGPCIIIGIEVGCGSNEIDVGFPVGV
jgi:hypothetical protein